MYTLVYFVGLVMCAIATGTLTLTGEYGLLVLGGGLILYPVFTQVIHPFVKKYTK